MCWACRRFQIQSPASPAVGSLVAGDVKDFSIRPSLSVRIDNTDLDRPLTVSEATSYAHKDIEFGTNEFKLPRHPLIS